MVETAPGTAGRLRKVGKSGKSLGAVCGAGALELLEVQLEGKKRVSGADFANGQRLQENESLGELS